MPEFGHLGVTAMPSQLGLTIEPTWMSIPTLPQQGIFGLTGTLSHAHEWYKIVTTTTTSNTPVQHFHAGTYWTQCVMDQHEYPVSTIDARLVHEGGFFSAMPIWQLSPTNVVTKQEKAALYKFTRQYEQLADMYARMLHEAGLSYDRKLEYARTRGASRLAELAERVSAQTTAQSAQVNKVLAGYRQIIESTKELHGRGSLLARLPEDVARRLARLHLLTEQPQMQPVTMKVETPAASAGALALAA